MSREETSYDAEDDDFDLTDTAEEFELDLNDKITDAASDLTPIAKRRMIEELLEERRLRKEIEDDFNLDDEDF